MANHLSSPCNYISKHIYHSYLIGAVFPSSLHSISKIVPVKQNFIISHHIISLIMCLNCDHLKCTGFSFFLSFQSYHLLRTSVSTSTPKPTTSLKSHHYHETLCATINVIRI
ncbi:hypothetical protein EYC80_003273 [Monilinia laxa]|uniref:Uncharacterized protein n=1 Tax=Monilinia laxa TaxID=61186 RepID=A0A5N6KD68_MONLA|nr:hypothetical protein EYC80_003273 [Monilinia laxa]